jgi:hypothetical protein
MEKIFIGTFLPHNVCCARKTNDNEAWSEARDPLHAITISGLIKKSYRLTQDDEMFIAL